MTESRHSLPATLVRTVDEHGFAVLSQALDPTTHDELSRAATRLLASRETRGRDRGADDKDGFRGVVNLDSTFLHTITNEVVLPIIVALLSCNIHVLSTHLICLPSVSSGQPRSIRTPGKPGWHRDMYGVTDDLGADATPRLAIKCAYYLTPPAPDTGTTMFLPGSHLRRDPVRVPVGRIDPIGAITPQIGPLDAILFENRVWHAGGLNTSGAPRIAFMVQYGYRWLAPVDDPASHLLQRGELTDVERQLLGGRDRAPDGSLAKGLGAAPIRTWWQSQNITQELDPVPHQSRLSSYAPPTAHQKRTTGELNS